MKYTGEVIFVIVGILVLAGIICFIIACCSNDYGGFSCYLCKAKVTEETWVQHRIDCARENEWFIERLPKSEAS